MSEHPRDREGAAGGEAEPAEAVDLADLKKRSVRGGSVTIVSKGASIGVQLVSTVILARLLTPEDYGILAMVVVVTAFASRFQDLGLSAATIQKKDITRAQQSNLFWLNVAVGAVLTTVVAAVSPAVAWFYGVPELVAVTIALSFTFVISSFGSQPGATLVREMQFGRQAAAQITGSVATLVTAVVLAASGFSYWSLVWGNLTGAVVSTALLFILSPLRPALPVRGAGIRDMVGFGANVTAFNFVNYFSRNLDNILIGRVVGAAALGFYSRAYQLLMFPIDSIRQPVNAVAFPAMSRLQGHPTAYRAFYRKTSLLVAFASMPVTAFLFIASGPVVDILLGPDWSEVSRIFALLAITGFIQPVASLRGNVLLSSGHGNRYLQWGIFNSVSVSIGFLIGIQWGVMGIAASYAIVNYAILYPSLLLAFKDTPLRPMDFFGSIAVPVAASLSAVAISLPVARLGAIQTMNPFIQVLALGTIFATSYLAVVALVPGGRQILGDLIALLPRPQRKPS